MRMFSMSFVGVLTILLQCITVSAASLTDVRFWSAPDHTRVVLDLTEPIKYGTSPRESPSQFHLELKDVTLKTRKKEVEVNDLFVKKMSLSDLKKGKVKLAFYQKK